MLPVYSADIGLIGLAVMGQNLILNMNGTFSIPSLHAEKLSLLSTQRVALSAHV